MAGLTGRLLLQVADPSAIIDLPATVRGPVAFVLVLVGGAVILRWYDGLIDRCVDASSSRPLSSLAYGIGAHLTVLFFGVYGASQLGQAAPGRPSLIRIGLWAAVVLLAVAAVIGFTVVGVTAVEIRWKRRRRHGLLLGAVIAGLAGIADPLLGGVVWIVVVSTGIGGPVRDWFNAAEDVESTR